LLTCRCRFMDIKQDAKVADNASRFHDGRTDFQGTVFRL